MITEKQYKSLMGFAKVYLHSKPHVLYEDIVNDVLLDMLQGGEPFSLIGAEKRIKHHPAINEKSINNFCKSLSKFDTERVCKLCKELLPVGLFYIVHTDQKSIVPSYCKSCHKKLMSIYQRTEIGKRNNKKRQERYRDAHPLKSKAARDASYKKMKETLSDAFIINCIKYKYGIDYLKQPENYHIIEAYREKRKKVIN